jgi:hypothetical protein
MGFLAYITYLVLLLTLPLLARWRWGLLVSLAVVVLELGMVVFVAMHIHQIFPPVPVEEPPAKGPMEVHRRMMRDSAISAFIVFYVGLIVPGAAAGIGGGLALLWSAAAAGWRAFRTRQAKVG